MSGENAVDFRIEGDEVHELAETGSAVGIAVLVPDKRLNGVHAIADDRRRIPPRHGDEPPVYDQQPVVVARNNRLQQDRNTLGENLIGCLSHLIGPRKAYEDASPFPAGVGFRDERVADERTRKRDGPIGGARQRETPDRQGDVSEETKARCLVLREPPAESRVHARKAFELPCLASALAETDSPQGGIQPPPRDSSAVTLREHRPDCLIKRDGLGPLNEFLKCSGDFL